MASLLTMACAKMRGRFSLGQGLLLLAVATVCFGTAIIAPQLDPPKADPQGPLSTTASSELWQQRLALAEREKQERQAQAATRPDSVPAWTSVDEAELQAIKARVARENPADPTDD